VVHMLAIPYQMAFASVYRRWLQAFHTAEQIMAQDERGRRSKLAEQKALKKTYQKLNKKLKSSKGIKEASDQILEELGDDLSRDEVLTAAKELLRQGSVLIWGALEVLARDLFVALLNVKPRLAAELFKDENSKRLFQVKGFNLEVLEQYNYNLSTSMGEILANHNTLDTPSSMKTVFATLLPNKEEIRTAFSDSQIWILFQRRHLVVHRRGVIDAVYLTNTGENLNKGTELTITPKDIDAYFRSILKVGDALIRGVSQSLN